MHPLCYIYMEVFTCCYLSIWDGDQKSMLALRRWISRCCVVWLFSLGFPSTFILKSLSAVLCIWEKIWKMQGAEIQQGQSRLLYCAISTNFLEKGYYVFGNDLGEIYANLCSYQDQVETEDLNVKVQLKSEVVCLVAICRYYNHSLLFILQDNGKGERTVSTCVNWKL